MIKQLPDAIRQGDGGAVQKLVESDRARVNARGGDGVPAVRLAFYYRHPEIAQMLIKHGAVLDIHDAAAAGRMERLRAVATTAAEVNSLSADGATALGLAAFFGHRDAVEFLLDRGAQIDMIATNPAFPFAALHSALSAGNQSIVDLLLARGAKSMCAKALG